jgi:hypothetical protein
VIGSSSPGGTTPTRAWDSRSSSPKGSSTAHPCAQRTRPRGPTGGSRTPGRSRSRLRSSATPHGISVGLAVQGRPQGW